MHTNVCSGTHTHADMYRDGRLMLSVFLEH